MKAYNQPKKREIKVPESAEARQSLEILADILIAQAKRGCFKHLIKKGVKKGKVANRNNL